MTYRGSMLSTQSMSCCKLGSRKLKMTSMARVTLLANSRSGSITRCRFRSFPRRSLGRAAATRSGKSIWPRVVAWKKSVIKFCSISARGSKSSTTPAKISNWRTRFSEDLSRLVRLPSPSGDLRDRANVWLRLTVSLRAVVAMPSSFFSCSEVKRSSDSSPVGFLAFFFQESMTCLNSVL